MKACQSCTTPLIKSGSSSPKFVGQFIVEPHPRPKRPSPAAVTPWAQISPNQPKSTFLPQQGFAQLKSGHSGPKFARHSIHCIVGLHQCPRRPSPPAATLGDPIGPKKGHKTYAPSINHLPPARFHADPGCTSLDNPNFLGIGKALNLIEEIFEFAILPL